MLRGVNLERRGDTPGSIQSKTTAIRMGSTSRRHRLAATLAAALYWVVYAYATGILHYYPQSVEEYLAGIPNPNWFFLPSSLTNIYFASGVVWFPNAHIEFALGLGPTATSIAIALLLGLNINATRSLKSTNLRLTGATSLLSALISGGCCSLPLLTSILAYASSSAVLLDSTLYNLAIPTSMAALALMTATYIYTTRRGTTKLGQDSESCCTPSKQALSRVSAQSQLYNSRVSAWRLPANHHAPRASENLRVPITPTPN